MCIFRLLAVACGGAETKWSTSALLPDGPRSQSHQSCHPHEMGRGGRCSLRSLAGDSMAEEGFNRSSCHPRCSKNTVNVLSKLEKHWSMYKVAVSYSIIVSGVVVAKHLTRWMEKSLATHQVDQAGLRSSPRFMALATPASKGGVF